MTGRKQAANWCLSSILLLVGTTRSEAQTQQEAQQVPPPPRAELEPLEPAIPPTSAFPGAALFNHQPPFLTNVAVDHADGCYREGEKLRVQFLAEREAQLYLIYHQADGTSVLLFPNEAQRDGRTSARQPVVIPAPGEEFRFRIRPPLGREVLQVLAATQPIPELDRLVTKAGRAPQVPTELFAALTERLKNNPSIWTEHRVPLRTLAKAVPSATRPPARVGLFIGVGKYLHPEYAPTHEELAHSAKVMHGLLVQHGGLDPQRTRLLMNEQATKANLQRHIVEWLPSVSRPGDTVFIYFSGHAGQVDCLDGSEADGKDECLGPYDLEGFHDGDTPEQARARFRATNIIDDTLARWLEELQGRQVVLILDTCHSGGVVEGKALARKLLRDTGTRVKDIAQMNVLVLTSCASDEQSLFEGPRNKTMWFTYCLTEAIEAIAGKHPLTVQQAFEYTRERMRQLLREGNAAREQEPQMTDTALLPVLLVP